jgi:hypothetical protein
MNPRLQRHVRLRIIEVVQEEKVLDMRRFYRPQSP